MTATKQDTIEKRAWPLAAVLACAGLIAAAFTALLWWLNIPFGEMSLDEIKTWGAAVSVMLLLLAALFGWCPPKAWLRGLAFDDAGRALRIVARGWPQIVESIMRSADSRVALSSLRMQGNQLVVRVRRRGATAGGWQKWGTDLAEGVCDALGLSRGRVIGVADNGRTLLTLRLLLLDATQELRQ